MAKVKLQFIANNACKAIKSAKKFAIKDKKSEQAQRHRLFYPNEETSMPFTILM